MYTKFYGLKTPPFRITPDPRFLYLSPSHREALATLILGIRERKGVVVLTGGVGTGKTTLLQGLYDRLDSEWTFVKILDPRAEFPEILGEMLDALGVNPDDLDRSRRMRRLDEELKARQPNLVLVIDEAQGLRDDVLEDLRLLSNLETQEQKLIQILLVGQPELRTRLESAAFEPLRQRIALSTRIEPLSFEESMAYVKHRLTVAGAENPSVFAVDAFEEVHDYAKGIPRLINVVCDGAMSIGYATESKRIHGTTVSEVVSDLVGELGADAPAQDPAGAEEKAGKQQPPWIWVVAAGLLLSAGLGLLAMKNRSPGVGTASLGDPKALALAAAETEQERARRLELEAELEEVRASKARAERELATRLAAATDQGAEAAEAEERLARERQRLELERSKLEGELGSVQEERLALESALESERTGRAKLEDALKSEKGGREKLERELKLIQQRMDGLVTELARTQGELETVRKPAKTTTKVAARPKGRAHVIEAPVTPEPPAPVRAAPRPKPRPKPEEPKKPLPIARTEPIPTPAPAPVPRAPVTAAEPAVGSQTLEEPLRIRDLYVARNPSVFELRPTFRPGDNVHLIATYELGPDSAGEKLAIDLRVRGPDRREVKGVGARQSVRVREGVFQANAKRQLPVEAQSGIYALMARFSIGDEVYKRVFMFRVE